MRLLVVAAGVATALLALAAPADAHAAVSSPGARPGAEAALTFQVPAESDTFKAIQIYRDGSQVHRTDVPAPGSAAEPEHPAPTLVVANPVAMPHSGNSQTASMAPASIALAVVVVALCVAVLRRRTT